MREELNRLISLGEQVLTNEVHSSDLPLPKMVKGSLCTKWKIDCLSLFDSPYSKDPKVKKIVDLASKRVLTAKCAKQLLALLKEFASQE